MTTEEVLMQLRRIRKARRLSQSKVASRLYMSRVAFTYIETGRTGLQMEMFLKLCEIYRVTPVQLFDDIPNENRL